MNIYFPFYKIIRLLDFNKTGYDTFRKWYVDGKIYHHIIIDEANRKDGIKSLIPVDALDIKKVREIKRSKDPVSNIEYTDDIEEYFIYKPDQTTGQFFPHGKHSE